MKKPGVFVRVPSMDPKISGLGFYKGSFKGYYKGFRGLM